jgi:7-cyano-7-deazaguanine synthase in queuosine biosynthesis
MENSTILAMYSGGLDSLGMLYKLFTDPEYKDYQIHIHHIHNRNVECRDLAEAIITNTALSEFKKMGFLFEYSESGITTKQYNGKFMFDCDSINFFAGYICSVNPNIVKVATGVNSEDITECLAARRKRADTILATFTSVQKIHPMMNISKLEIYNTLPDNLKDKFWSCRVPIQKNGSISPCGVCHTCQQLKSADIPHIVIQ